MALETFPEGGGSRNQFTLKSISSQDLTSSTAAQDHNSLEETIDLLVDLLSNGDIGKQRQAAEALATLRRASRDRLREIDATSLLVDRQSSPDVHIREHMMTLLFRLAADEEDDYRQRSRHPDTRAAVSGDKFNKRTTLGVIYNFLRAGPGPKAYETAAKLLIKLTNIDRLKDTMASSGGLEALIEMLRFKAGLSFQKEAISSLIGLLKYQDGHKARAIKGGLPSIILRTLVHAPPPVCDIDGILELMAVLATYDVGHDVLVQNNTPQALVMLVSSGKLVASREKVARLVRTLTEDHQARLMVEDLITPGGEGGEDLGKGTIRIDVPLQNGDRNGEKEPHQHAEIVEIPDIELGAKDPRTNSPTSDSSTPPGSNGDDSNRGSKPPQKPLRNGRGSKSPKDIKGPERPENAAASKTVPAVPKEFVCFLSHEIMKDPVTVSTDVTYEREYIQKRIDEGKLTCPVSKYRLKNTYLRPNYKLKARISNWYEKNVELPSKETEQKKLKEEVQEQQQAHGKLQPEAEVQVGHPKPKEDKPSFDNGIVASREVDLPPSSDHNRSLSEWSKVNNIGHGPDVGSTGDPVRSSLGKSGTLDNGGDQGRSAANGDLMNAIPAHPPNDNDATNDPENEDDDGFPSRNDQRPATDEEIALVQTLMEILTSRKTSEPDLREAALQLHSMAYGCQSLRDAIVIVGALDALASLLSPEHTVSTQEAGIATLLLLSLDDENKALMAHQRSAVIPAVVGLLRNGSETAREQAASTLFSLSLPDENKVSIGASDAIPALVDILSGRDPRSKKAQNDTATCLLTLSIYTGNKARAVRAGVVPHLVALLDDESLLDLVLAMLAVLSSHVEGRDAIQEESTILPKLAQILRSGTLRNTENALTILLAVLMRNPALIKEAERLGVEKTILNLCNASGPGTIKTKTLRFLEFVRRHETSSRGLGSRG